METEGFYRDIAKDEQIKFNTSVNLTLLRMGGGGKKAPSYQFFPSNFYKRRIRSPKLSDF